MKYIVSSVLAAMLATGAYGATYKPKILDGPNEPRGSAGPYSYSIDNNGNVARLVSRTIGNAYDAVKSIWVRDVQGNNQYFGATNGFATSIGDYRAPIILEDGSFIAVRSMQEEI